jgi:hypothetical protein
MWYWHWQIFDEFHIEFMSERKTAIVVELTYAFDITDGHGSESPQLSPVSTDCLPWQHVSGTLTKIRKHLMMMAFWRVWGCGEDGMQNASLWFCEAIWFK